jgi:hypothetical protein
MINRYILAAILLVPTLAASQSETPPRCADEPIYSALDFWVGEWNVFIGDEKVGHNLIAKVLDGCAITEDWTGADGGSGKSLFFLDNSGRWKQVWVTQWAMAPGGVKEKMMVGGAPDGGVRFQGELKHPEAGSWLDRTTLTPAEGGDVRQLIEISKDNGKSWQTSFDAVYQRVAGT